MAESGDFPMTNTTTLKVNRCTFKKENICNYFRFMVQIHGVAVVMETFLNEKIVF